MQIQRNVKLWGVKKGCQPRLLEYAYRVLFREIWQQTLDFTAILEKKTAEYSSYLDTESGNGALGKNMGL